jgi:hypothetical protein
LDGTALWRLDQHGITFVMSAKAHRAVMADAQAQVGAGEGITVDRRVHMVFTLLMFAMATAHCL